MKFAGIHKLPILYVTRSAGLDEPGRRKHGALEEFSFMAKDYGFPSILVDGKDVVAVWRAAQESIHRARNGSGPTLIECQTEPAYFKDPLVFMQHYMTRRGALLMRNAAANRRSDQRRDQASDAAALKPSSFGSIHQRSVLYSNS